MTIVSKKNKLFISAGIILILAIALGYYYFNDEYAIKTKSGIVRVNNFMMEINSADNNYLIKSGLDYDLNYYKPDQFFTITIFNKNLNAGRNKAENDFLTILGINKTDACKLDVALYVPIAVNYELGGSADYGLSFCPDGIPFPGEKTQTQASPTLFQKLLDFLKNPLTVALGAAFVIVAGIILFARR